MRYIELKISSAGSVSEELQSALMEAGFTSMQIDDPRDAEDIARHRDLYKYDYINEEILEKAEGNAPVTVTLYFTDDDEGRCRLSDAEALVAGLREDGMAVSCETSLTGDDSEWLYKWQEHFRPAKVGSRIVVKPSWEGYKQADGELVIEMDPGMAFGSGLHATTSMCIRALEKYIPSVPGRIKVLDVGTGTGILAMAAVLLGAGDALGIDIDEEAIRVSKENIGRNGLADRIHVTQGDLMAGVDYAPDIIVANLMADLVVKLSPAAAAALNPGGLYITSGILDVKEETVAEAVRAAGFEIKEIMADGEWRAIVAVRQE